MKNILFNWVALFVFLGIVPITFIQCEKENLTTDDFLYVSDEGYTNFKLNNLQDWLKPAPTKPLNAQERADLEFMREEEKLAHDLYAAFYDLYGKQIFTNIASSEQTHTEAVLMLLDRYSIPDPVGNNGPSEFTNPDLQQLYNDLLAEGQKGLVNALTVGIQVEEIDILDLQQRIDNTFKEDIITIYNNLEKGSRNHLRAYYRNLQNAGVEYSPVYLPETEFWDIVNSPNERGSN